MEDILFINGVLMRLYYCIKPPVNQCLKTNWWLFVNQYLKTLEQFIAAGF